jgi:predicted GIY-YIG superfamily endonuclease
MSVCYCLVRSDSGATYIGATVDMEHRLRQHNGELAGGAHYTSAALPSGKTWELACTVGPFPTWQAALQFEWKWKNVSRKRPEGPLGRRIRAAILILNMDRPTSKAELFETYAPLTVYIFKTTPETDWLLSEPMRFAIAESVA